VADHVIVGEGQSNSAFLDRQVGDEEREKGRRCLLSSTKKAPVNGFSKKGGAYFGGGKKGLQEGKTGEEGKKGGVIHALDQEGGKQRKKRFLGKKENSGASGE